MFEFDLLKYICLIKVHTIWENVYETKVKQNCELDMLQNRNVTTAKPGIIVSCHTI